MKESASRWPLIVIVVFLFSYVFNFVWESWHGVFLYEEHNFVASKYVTTMNYVSIMDAAIITGMYLLAAIVWRDLLWLRKWDILRVAVFLIIGVFVAAVIEYMAVYMLKEWSYNASMPTVFGIGLSPLMQLSVTGVCGLYVTKRLLCP